MGNVWSARPDLANPRGKLMKLSLLATWFLLSTCSTANAQKCPTIDIAMLNRGFADVGTWRAISGGPGECSFMARSSSVSFGFNHLVSPSVQAAQSAAADMRKAVAATSRVEPLANLGEDGFTYQQKGPNGQVDPTSMFFYGSRGSVGVSGYLNLPRPITPEQRLFAANLIVGTLGVASNARALVKASNCRYLDPELVQKLLPAADVTTSIPDADNCVVSAGGSTIVVSVTRGAGNLASAQNLLNNGGCTVTPVPALGRDARIAHACTVGNARAQVVTSAGGRNYVILYTSGAEPSAAERDVLIALAKGAAGK